MVSLGLELSSRYIALDYLVIIIIKQPTFVQLPRYKSRLPQFEDIEG